MKTNINTVLQHVVKTCFKNHSLILTNIILPMQELKLLARKTQIKPLQ